MPKIVGTRERVHQPFYDTLIRVDGSTNPQTISIPARSVEKLSFHHG